MRNVSTVNAESAKQVAALKIDEKQKKFPDRRARDFDVQNERPALGEFALKTRRRVKKAVARVAAIAHILHAQNCGGERAATAALGGDRSKRRRAATRATIVVVDERRRLV